MRILNQSELTTRQYQDKTTGEQKVKHCVSLKLSNGIDTFYGVISGERAVNCPKFDQQYLYRVQFTMVAREWTSSQTGDPVLATTIHIDRIHPA